MIASNVIFGRPHIINPVYEIDAYLAAFFYLHAEGRPDHEVDIGVVVVGGIDAGVVVDPLLSAHEVGGPPRCYGQALHELKIRYSINI